MIHSAFVLQRNRYCESGQLDETIRLVTASLETEQRIYRVLTGHEAVQAMRLPDKFESSYSRIGKTADRIEEIAQTLLVVRKNILTDGSETFDVVAKDAEFDVPCRDEAAAYFCRFEIAAAIYRATQ